MGSVLACRTPSLHCESLTSLLDIHVIENRCGRIDSHAGTRGSGTHPLHRSRTNRETEMSANVMNILDRTAMIFVVILAATPMLSIAARAAFL